MSIYREIIKIKADPKFTELELKIKELMDEVDGTLEDMQEIMPEGYYPYINGDNFISVEYQAEED